MEVKQADGEVSRSVFDWNGKPGFGQALPLSLQHILAMVMGAVTVPIIVAGAAGVTPAEATLLIQMSLIFSGLSTLLQLYGVSILAPGCRSSSGLASPMSPRWWRLPLNTGLRGSWVPRLWAVSR